ncbi:MAG: hypothetical protein ACOYY2_03915 [Actinomycetota bacterium]
MSTCTACWWHEHPVEPRRGCRCCGADHYRAEDPDTPWRDLRPETD